MNTTTHPQFAVIMLQPHCNMECSFCITENSLHQCDWKGAMEILETLKNIGIQNLILGGGEPFFWPHDVLKLSRTAHNRGFQIQIGTNGIRLPKGFEWESSVRRYVLPLESDNPSIHNSIRHYKNRHFSLILDAIEKLSKAKKELSISTVITRQNLETLPSLKRFLVNYHEKSKNIHAWHLYQFVPAGRGGRSHESDLAIPGEIYWKAVRKIKEGKTGFEIFARPNMYHSKTVGFYWYNGKSWRDCAPPANDCHVF